MDDRVISNVIFDILKYNDYIIPSRIALHKLFFLLNEVKDLGLHFEMEYHGPYSHEVSDALQRLIGIGFLERDEIEEETVFPLDDYKETVRYKYEVTTGNVEAYIEKKQPSEHVGDVITITSLFDALDWDVREISLVSKVVYMVSHGFTEELEKQ